MPNTILVGHVCRRWGGAAWIMEKAKEWYQEAADQGLKEAIDALKELENNK